MISNKSKILFHSSPESIDTWVIRLTLFLSGFCGIAYEILYNRLLGNIIGNHFVVNTSILVTFLLGIGLGTKYAHYLKGYLWAIETGIGLYAIGFTLLLPQFDSFLFNILPLANLPINILISCALLVIPAFLVGVSLPLFAAYLQFLVTGRAFSRSYFIYNFGAAFTAFVIEFILIRNLGLRQAVFSVAAINLSIGTILFTRRKKLNLFLKPMPLIKYPLKIIVPLVVVSVASAIFQLTMLKFAEFVYGPFHETFAMVLGIVLLGIALGTHMNHYHQIRFRTFVIINLVYLSLLILFFPLFVKLYATVWGYLPEKGLLIWKLYILFLLMGPSAICFGAAIPALMKDESDIARESGYLLFISSIANAAGYLLMVFVIHSRLEYGQILNLIIGLLILTFIIRSWPRWHTSGIMIVVGVFSFFSVKFTWSEDFLYLDYVTFTSPQKIQEEILSLQSGERFRKYDETFSINQIGQNKYFFINGYTSVPFNSSSEYLVGLVSSLVAPRLNEGLVLGLGSGATAGTVAEVFKKLDIVEISPTIIEKQFLMKEYSFDVMSKPNVNVICDDGIRFLKTTPRKYDLILNTVTSPLYFSSSKLYTRDFYQQVKTHLKEDGIYTTWLDSRVGEMGVKIILTTLKSEFKYCWVTQIKSNYYLLVVSNNPLAIRQDQEIDSNSKLSDFFASKHGLNIHNLRYSITNTNPYDYLSINETIPLNTIDLPGLEFEIARLNNPTIQSFSNFLLQEYSIDRLNSEIFTTQPIEILELIAYNMKIDHESAMTQHLLKLTNGSSSNYIILLEKYMLDFFSATASQYRTPESLNNLAYWYWFFNHIQEAEKVYRDLAAIDADFYDVYLHIGLARFFQEDYADAITYFDKELAKDSDHCDALFWAGRANLQLGELKEARKVLKRCLKQQPWYDDVNLLLAQTFQYDQLDSVIYYLKQEIKLDPDDRKARRLLYQIQYY